MRYEMPYLISREFLREYVERYQPLALPTLVREPDGSAAGGAASTPPGPEAGTAPNPPDPPP